MTLDSHEATCLERSWNAFGLLLALIRRLTGSSLFTRQLKWRTYRLLRAGEALARRLLILAALDRELPAPTAPRSPHPEPAEGGKASSAARKPGFPLEEGLPAFHPLSDSPFYLRTPQDIPSTDPDAPASADHALARLRTLEALLLDPSRQIARMARWLAGHVRLVIGRRSPLCLRGVSSSPDADMPANLPDADLFARRALHRAANPSPG